MRYLLSRRGREALRQLAWSNVLLAFDYDGTLAPLVPDPERVELRASTRRLLAEVSRDYPCVVLSGRARADVRRRLRGAGTLVPVGERGGESWQVSRRLLRSVQSWLPLLERRLAPLAGVRIEDRKRALAVRYERSREKTRARAQIRKAAASIGDVRLVPGRHLVSVVPATAPDKGLALQRARTRLGCDTAFYVGDADADEEVFALDEPGRLLTVRIGRRPESLAHYFLRSQREIDSVLRLLRGAGAERRGSARGRRR